MLKIRHTYKLIVLLIVVSAFPVSIAAMNDLDHTDPLICKFHETEKNNGITVNCDHCNYFFDVAPNLAEKTIYEISDTTLLKLSDRNSLSEVSYIFNSSRSPPIS